MAWTDTQDKDKNQQGDGQVVGGAFDAGGQSQGAFSGGSPVSTAGVGQGGTGGWTNIQSYLQANQGDTKSADLLNSQVGGQFDKESKNLQDQSNQTESQAKSQVDQNNIGQDQASQILSQASGLYNYGGNQSQDYQNLIGQIQNPLNASYQGPNQFAYGTGAATQNYGSNLSNDQGFRGMMENMYNQSAGGQLGSGLLALQNQIDTNNGALKSARSDLQGRYGALNNNVNDTTKNTNDYLSSEANQFSSNQKSLKDYLQSQQGSDQQSINNAVNAWNADESAIQSGANKVYAGGNVRGNQNVYGTAPNPHDGPPVIGQINADNYYDSYSPGSVANASNIGGIDSQRNHFNTIANILGLGTIGKDGSAPTHGSWNFDSNKYNDAVNKMIQDWKDQQATNNIPSPSTPYSSNTSWGGQGGTFGGSYGI